MSSLRLTLFAPSAIEDDLVAELWSAGTCGVEVQPRPDSSIALLAYFLSDSPPEEAAIDAWRRLGAEVSAYESVADQDWLATYRDLAVPLPVGRSLLIDPREPGLCEPVSEPGRITLTLPARAAFGTGSHETTRLVLQLLESLRDAGRLERRRVLDVGTGTGILAFAALLFGAASVDAFDVDPAASIQARDNSRRNKLFPRLFVGELGCLRPRSSVGDEGYDLVLVNILPERFMHQAALLMPLLNRGGEMIVAGLLETERESIEARFTDLGVSVLDRRLEGEWAGLYLRMPPAPSGQGVS